MEFIVKCPRSAWVVEVNGQTLFRSDRQVDALALALNAALERSASDGRGHRVVLARSGGERVEIAAFGPDAEPANDRPLSEAA